MSQSYKLGHDIARLHDNMLTTKNQMIFSHNNMVWGVDSQKTNQEDIDRYNGIIRHPRGFVAQFAGPPHPKTGQKLIYVFAAHRPEDLGEYIDGEYVMTPKCMKSQAYLIAVLPDSATGEKFDMAVSKYFERHEEQESALNLFGHAQYLEKENEEDRLVILALSRHISYLIREVGNERYLAGANEGKGSLTRRKAGVVDINPSEAFLLNEVGEIVKRYCEPIRPRDYNGTPLSEFFPHTAAALKEIQRDWDTRMTKLWDGRNLSDNIKHRVKQEVLEFIDQHGHRPWVIAVMAACAQEYFIENKGLNDFFTTAIGLGIIGEVANRGGEVFFNWLKPRIASKDDDLVNRDYASDFWLRAHIKADRLAKKADPAKVGKLVRLKAVNPEGARSVYGRFDKTEATDPSKPFEHPRDYWIAAASADVNGWFCRSVDRHTMLLEHSMGMAILANNSVPEGEGRISNKTIQIATYMPPDIPKKERRSMSLKQALAETLKEIFMNAMKKPAPNGRHGTFTPFYPDALDQLNNRLRLTMIDRRASSLSFEEVDRLELRREYERLVTLDGYRGLPRSEQLFFGLGKEPYSHIRLQGAFGFSPQSPTVPAL